MISNTVYGAIFDLSHSLYIVLSLFFTVLVLYLAKKYIKEQKYKDIFLKIWAVMTVFLHISTIWVSFLKDEPAIAADNILFPIYFCNFSMYLLVIVAFYANKSSKTFKNIAIVVAYSGIFGSLISLFYPEYYLNAPNMFEWGVFKSLLSHSTMLIGALYIMVGGYIKIEKKNTIVFIIGLFVFALVGVAVNMTFKLAGLYKPNAMYLQHPPIEEAPFLNAYVIGVLMILVTYGISALYEKILKIKEEKILLRRKEIRHNT